MTDNQKILIAAKAILKSKPDTGQPWRAVDWETAVKEAKAWSPTDLEFLRAKLRKRLWKALTRPDSIPHDFDLCFSRFLFDAAQLGY